jgi:hypothetical protein
LSVAEYLDTTARKERKLLIEKMIQARKLGHYAVLRNNKLYINGKRAEQTQKQTKYPEETKTYTHEQYTEGQQTEDNMKQSQDKNYVDDGDGDSLSKKTSPPHYQRHVNTNNDTAVISRSQTFL